MLQVLIAISQKFYCRKETWGYAQVIHKKGRKKRIEKIDIKVSEVSKTIGT